MGYRYLSYDDKLVQNGGVATPEIPITQYDLTGETWTPAQVDDWLDRLNVSGLSSTVLKLGGNTYTSASATDRSEMGARFVTIIL